MADTSAFDEQIAQLDARIAEVCGRLEELYVNFLAATAAWAREMYEADVDQAISGQPERVKELGPDRLSQLKKELAQLGTDADKIAEDELGKVAWGHRAEHKPPDGRGYHENPFRVYRQIPNLLDEPLRRVRGRPGLLFVDAGLMYSGTRVAIGGAAYRYQGAYGWSDTMREVMTAYGKLYDELLGAYRARDRAEHDKASAEAAELWEDA